MSDPNDYAGCNDYRLLSQRAIRELPWPISPNHLWRLSISIFEHDPRTVAPGSDFHGVK
jgi:hypothetical protein